MLFILHTKLIEFYQHRSTNAVDMLEEIMQGDVPKFIVISTSDAGVGAPIDSELGPMIPFTPTIIQIFGML